MIVRTCYGGLLSKSSFETKAVYFTYVQTMNLIFFRFHLHICFWCPIYETVRIAFVSYLMPTQR